MRGARPTARQIAEDMARGYLSALESALEPGDAAAEPLGRYTTAAEQAGPIVLLCSDAMSVVNGIVLPVDGGFMGGLTTGQVDISKMIGKAKASA